MAYAAIVKAIESGDLAEITAQFNEQGLQDCDNYAAMFHLARRHMPQKAASAQESLEGQSMEGGEAEDKGSRAVARFVIKQVLESEDPLRQLEKLAMAGVPLQDAEEVDDAREDLKDKLKEMTDAQAKLASVSTIVRNSDGPVDAEQLTSLGSLACALTSDGLGLLHQALVYGNTEAANSILAALPSAANALDYMKRSPLHYAAVYQAAPTVYQQLIDAGASESLQDLMGKTPQDYVSNPELLSLTEARSESARCFEAKATTPPEFSADDTSGVQTTQAEEEKVQEEPLEKQEDSQEEKAKEEEEVKAPEPIVKRVKPVDMYVRSQERKESPAPPPHTAEGRYIAQHLGRALTDALAEIAEVRPWDPIEYLARWLYKYRQDEAYTRKQAELLQTIRDEEAKLAREEELKFQRMEELKRYQEEEAEKRRIEEEERKKKEQEELLRSAKESNLAQKPALPTVSEEGEEVAAQEDEEDDGEEDDDTTVKDRDKLGQTELHKLAAQQGVDFSALIQLGYSIADRDVNGKTARDIAHDAGQTETVAAIDKYLRQVIEEGSEDVLEQLVLDGFQGLEGVNKEGLPQATTNCLDRLSALRELISSTMKNVTSREGSVQAEVSEAVNTQPLLARAKDEAGRSILHLAVLADAKELVAHLADKFPSTLKGRDNCNRTPLHYAWATSPEMAETLIAKGASPKARDAMKKKPAYYKANNAEIKRLQASLGLGPAQTPVPEVSVSLVEGQEENNAGESQQQQEKEEDDGGELGTAAATEDQQVATVIGGD